MALNTQLSDLVVNTQADALNALFNGGKIKIYDGSQPASADTAVTTQTLGVTLTLGNPAFGAAVSGLLTANPITSGVAVASITPTWARITKSDGSTVLMDVSVGVSGANLTLGGFSSGATIGCTSFTHDVKNATTGL